MRYSLIILVLVVSSFLAACPRKPGPAPTPATTTVFSSELGIRITYEPAKYYSIASNAAAEFPLTFSASDCTIGIKRLSNVGILLQKDPQVDFFRFFAQQVRFDLIDVGKLSPMQPEVNEEFTAQGKPGLRQILHFAIPKDMENLPSFVPQEPGAEVWIYYHHFYYKPDYYFFVAVSRQALPKEQLDEVVKLIETAQFHAQPLANGK